MVIFHSYVSLPEGIRIWKQPCRNQTTWYIDFQFRSVVSSGFEAEMGSDQEWDSKVTTNPIFGSTHTEHHYPTLIGLV